MTTTLPLDAITHPASKRLFKISDLTRAQRGALQTFVAADCTVLRATGVVSNVIHDSLTVEVFESLPDIRYHYVNPYVMTRNPYVMTGSVADAPLVMDISRYAAYLMMLTGQIDTEERSEFEVTVRELFRPHHKFFWPLLNSWCEVLVELGLTRRLTRELYLHDVLEEHKIEFSDKDALTPAAQRFLEAVNFVRGDVAVAILGIEYEVFWRSGKKPFSTAPVHLRKQPRERFASTRVGERAVCLGCGETFKGARTEGIRKVRAHIPNCAPWSRLDELASQMVPLNAADLNVIVDRALENGTIPRLNEYIELWR